MEDHVTATIKQQNIKMHSQRYFVVRRMVMLIGAAILFSILLFLVSFMIFVLHENGGSFAAGYGLNGLAVFFVAIPWSILLIALALIFVLSRLLRRYAFVYHQPLLYPLLFLAIVISFAGFFIASSSLHEGLMEYVTHNKFPFLVEFYNYETMPPSNIYRGTVIGYVQNGFLITNIYNQTSTISIPAGTPFSSDNLKIGDTMIVFGHKTANGTIMAYGLEKVAASQ